MINWGGKKWKPTGSYKRQPINQSIEELMKPLGEKFHKGNVWQVIMDVPHETTPEPTPSNTPSNTPTPSITASQTQTPTNTPTQTPSNTATQTPTPTNTQTPTNTETPTNTPTQTQTGTPDVTPTSTSTPTNTPTQTQTGTPAVTPTNTPTPSTPASGTTEALIYLNRVVQSGGTVNATASAATITLFTSLVSNNLWDKIYAMYPVLGGIAASHTINARSSVGTYDLTFNGGWTHNSSGMKGNGTNGYAQTNFNPNTVMGNGGTSHLSVYVNLQGSGDRIYDMGVATTDSGLNGMLNIAAKRSLTTGNNTLFDAGDYNGGIGRVQTTTQTSASGMTVGSYRSATDKTLYRNGLNIATQTTNNPSAYANRTLVIAAQSSLDSNIAYYSDNRYGFATIGSGLTNTDIVNLSSIINTYQTSLGRNTY